MILWQDSACDDYLFWQERDRRTLKRANLLLQDIARHPFDGIGKPEPLQFDFAGCWSRRIDAKNRLIHLMRGYNIRIISCKVRYINK